MFNQPQSENSGTWFKPKDHDGSLILFETVIEGGREFDQMANAEREYRLVTFVDLDSDCTPYTVKVTHKGIVAKLPLGATNILGRIEQIKTSNGYLAWVLSPHKPEDAAQAKAWIDGGRKPAVDPFGTSQADELGLTAEQLATMKRLGMIKDDSPGF